MYHANQGNLLKKEGEQSCDPLEEINQRKAITPEDITVVLAVRLQN